ncbi:hypothetical protein VP01_1032g2 [Puccinia sorghi]|uniref:Reverse transcriptase Ty1/copia-type domain-containing protein n=1 Tax=Puccinia sorghi TaxID=27349 RepID=A0A0L6VVY4_9BASI|nr:hypothetical protein VP01_1032g2 [Puccinia sorghi]
MGIGSGEDLRGRRSVGTESCSSGHLIINPSKEGNSETQNDGLIVKDKSEKPLSEQVVEKAHIKEEEAEDELILDEETHELETTEEDSNDNDLNFAETLVSAATKLVTKSSRQKAKSQFYYIETFAPTGNFLSFLTLLVLEIDLKLPFKQLYVKSIFLLVLIEEGIFIKYPEGSKRKAPFIKVVKSLYSLKQAPKNWLMV